MRRSILTMAALACVLLLSRAAFAGTCKALGNATDCNLIITIGNGGAVSTHVNSGVSPYDGVEDQYIGVVNNATDGFVLNSLFINGGTNAIFGFDGDGAFGPSCITTNLGSAVACGTGGDNVQHTGSIRGDDFYNGAGTYFVINSNTQGTVFFNGGLAGGSSAFFSLELPAGTFNSSGISVNTAPEPASLMLLGAGLIGAGIRRRSK